MKRLALVLLLFASVYTLGQYSATYTQGVTDLTAYCTNATNCWKALPAHTFTGVSTGVDGAMYYLDSTGAVWLYDQSARTYTKQTALGTSVKQLVVNMGTDIWSLQTTTHCTSLGAYFGIFHWDVNDWDLSNGTQCASSLSVALDRTLFSIYAGKVYKSINAGVTWTAPAFGTGWKSIAGSDSDSATAIKTSGTVWDLNFATVQATQLGTLSNAKQVVVSTVRDGWGPTVITTTGAVENYSYTAGTWATLYGLSASAISQVSQSLLTALNTSGQPYHYNVYGGYIAGSYAGSTTQCLGGIGTCPQGVVHTALMTVGFPHGVYGVQGSAAGAPTTYISANSWDASPQCDPLLGNPGDPECVPSASGAVECSAAGNASFGEPSQPPAIPLGISTSAHAWDTDVSTYSTPIIGGWGGTAVCGATINACAVSTTPFCQPPGHEVFVATAIGPLATPTMAENLAKLACKSGDPATGMSWQVIMSYEIINGLGDTNTCTFRLHRVSPFGATYCN